MLLSDVSVLVVAQSSSEIPEGLMNNPVYKNCASSWSPNGSENSYFRNVTMLCVMVPLDVEFFNILYINISYRKIQNM